MVVDPDFSSLASHKSPGYDEYESSTVTYYIHTIFSSLKRPLYAPPFPKKKERKKRKNSNRSIFFSNWSISIRLQSIRTFNSRHTLLLYKARVNWLSMVTRHRSRDYKSIWLGVWRNLLLDIIQYVSRFEYFLRFLLPHCLFIRCTDSSFSYRSRGIDPKDHQKRSSVSLLHDCFLSILLFITYYSLNRLKNIYILFSESKGLFKSLDY